MIKVVENLTEPDPEYKTLKEHNVQAGETYQGQNPKALVLIVNNNSILNAVRLDTKAPFLSPADHYVNLYRRVNFKICVDK